MRAAIVIGVDKVDKGLPPLQAAASGAAEVAEWLRRSDYEVILISDQEGPVTRNAIFDAVTLLIQKGTVEQLVIYFAGHGFLKGPLDEYWLLSRTPIDPSEAVNVTYSAAAIRYRGIPRIIFISDACRVIPQSNIHAGITGGSIVPNLEPSRRSAEIDFYYATQPGDPAHERTATEAECAHGLFTKELINAHKAAPQEALLTIGNREYVRNDWLKEIMEDRVSILSETISLRLSQLPDVQIQIRNGYIALNEDNHGNHPKSSLPNDLPNSTNNDTSDIAHNRFPKHTISTPQPRSAGTVKWGASKETFHRQGLNSRAAPLSRQDIIIKDAARTGKYFEERLNLLKKVEQALPSKEEALGFNYETRITCIGDSFIELSFGAGIKPKSWTQNFGRTYHFNLVGQASQIAVRFSDGTGMLLPVIHEFACTIVRHEGRTLSVSYSWLRGQEPRLGELRAEVLSAATLGLLTPSRSSAQGLAQRLRRFKRYDPILGLVAALAYTLAGDAAGASSVRTYMLRDLRVDLFDSWLLGCGDKGFPIYPSLPLLAQSWTFLDVFNIPFPEELKQLHRVAGFWTVFEAESMSRVIKLATESPAKGP